MKKNEKDRVIPPVSTTEISRRDEYDEVRDEDDKSRSFTNVLEYFIMQSNLKKAEVAVRLRMELDNLKRYRSGKRKPARDIVIRIAMVLMLDIEDANRLLKSAEYADLSCTNKSDRIILKYYEPIVEQFREITDPNKQNPKVFELNEALCAQGCEKLFEGDYL